MVRDDFSDLVYRTQKEKYAAIIDDIKACGSRQQPVLVDLPDLSIMTTWTETVELCGTAEIALSGNLACHTSAYS